MLILAVLALTSVAAQAQPGQPEAFASKANEFLDAHAAVNDFSGSVLVARNGKVLLRRGVGLANRELNVSNHPETRFRLGSVTKQFTAVSILLLEQQGKLKVEDTLDQHVADCPEAWKTVTIHHLLSHTSGIPSFTDDPAYQKDMVLPMPMPELLGRFRGKPLQFEPGSQWRYSNSGYALLGHLIEKLSGESYETFLRKNVLDPLGMKNTGYDRPETILPHRASGYAKGRGGGIVNAAYLDMSWPHAAGALYSTVDDLYLWDQALYTEKLLPKAALDRAFTPVKNNYGYGWGIGKAGGHKQIAHGGGINGFSTFVARYPDERGLVVVLSNLEQANASRIAQGLRQSLDGEAVEAPKPRREISLDPAVFDRYAGKYELSPVFAITFTREGARFYAQATGQPKIEIYPESESKFFLRAVDAQVTFVKGSDGRVNEMVLHQNGRDVGGKRVE